MGVRTSTLGALVANVCMLEEMCIKIVCCLCEDLLVLGG